MLNGPKEPSLSGMDQSPGIKGNKPLEQRQRERASTLQFNRLERLSFTAIHTRLIGCQQVPPSHSEAPILEKDQGDLIFQTGHDDGSSLSPGGGQQEKGQLATKQTLSDTNAEISDAGAHASFLAGDSVKDVNSFRSLQQSEETRVSTTLHKFDGTSRSETDTWKVDLDTETEYLTVPNQASSPHLFLSLHTFAPKDRGVELGRGDSGEVRQNPSKSHSLVDQAVQPTPDTKSTLGNQSSGLNWPMNSQASLASDLSEKGGLEGELRLERPAVGSKDRQLAYRHVDMAGQLAEVSIKRTQQHIVPRSTAFDDLPRAVPRSFEDPMERHPAGVDLVPKPMASSLSGHIQLGRFSNGSNAQVAGQNSTNFLMGDRRQSPAFSNFGSDEAVANRAVLHRYGNDFNHQIRSVGTVPQPVPIAPGSDASEKLTRFDAELQDVADISTTSLHQASGATDGSAHMMGRSGVPKPVIQQLLDALIREPGRPVEVSLDPEELGRVRMKMSVAESSVVVSILAERPESLELLRRNIDQLAEEFRALGYSQIAFDFGDTHSGGSKSSTQASPADNEPTVQEDPLPFNRPANTYDRDGLDMRL